MGAEVLLRRMIKGVYDSTELDSVPEIARREFGIGELGRKISSRHLSFKNKAALNAFLREKTPFYISYSSARYEFPDARPMEKKNLLGADLIYEFDADDIRTDCKTKHDSWKCKSCGKSGKGRQLACDKCTSGTVVDEWVCNDCLGETKRQSLKLISFLEEDFGISEGIAINFSGSKGYHIHVRNSSVQNLSKSARKELLDYISATGLNMAALGFDINPATNSYACPKKIDAKGWSQRILVSLEQAFNSNDTSKLEKLGNITQASANKLLNEKKKIIEHMDNGVLAFPSTIKQDAKKFWEYAVKNVVDSSKIEIKSDIIHDELLHVDRQTSIDIHKIVRVPDTVHGSTGLLAKSFPPENLSSFNPLAEAVVMPENELKVSNAIAPEFWLKGKKFGPFRGEDVSLPAYAAFFLLARGAAQGAL